MNTTITIADITVGAKFQTPTGKVWVIDEIQDNEKFGPLVRTHYEGGQIGNYKDPIAEVAAFLTEENCVKIA